MSYVWEREYINKRIKELKEFIEKYKDNKEVVFLAEKFLEVYEFQLQLLNRLRR